MFHGAKGKHFQYARQNRRQPTPAEDLLWNLLSDKQLGGFKFRRQHPAGPYILDFYCHAARLSVELDGGYHLDTEQQQYDTIRTEDLRHLGILELRFTNKDLFNDPTGLLEAIWQVAEERVLLFKQETSNTEFNDEGVE